MPTPKHTKKQDNASQLKRVTEDRVMEFYKKLQLYSNFQIFSAPAEFKFINKIEIKETTNSGV